jgi:hypothetical protein
MVDRTRISIMPATIHGIDVNGNPEPQKSTSNAVHVLDVAGHPGEDSTFDRTYGGRMPSSKSALTVTGQVGAAGARKYHGYVVTGALSAAAITLYDGTSATGTVIDVIPASTAAGSFRECAIPCSIGIYASFGGTGTVLFLYS